MLLTEGQMSVAKALHCCFRRAHALKNEHRAVPVAREDAQAMTANGSAVPLTA